MKTLITALTFLTLSSAYAVGSIQCQHDERKFTLSKKSYFEQIGDFVDLCTDAVGMGDICFNGKQSEAIEALAIFDEQEPWGSDAYLYRLGFEGEESIYYQIHDYEHDETYPKIVINRCK